MSDDFSAYGHGKLLITSEYFVLDGALALAVPTAFGQHVRVKILQAHSGLLYWVALDSQHKPWLKVVMDKVSFKILVGESEAAVRLSSCLAKARELNPDFLTGDEDIAVETLLEFPNNWGLGSSSTFIFALAAWAGVNAYTLLQATLGGSGYDVACAGSHTPILYSLENHQPQIQVVEWSPTFKHQIYFAHLGKKKLSSEGIRYYKEKLTDRSVAANHLTEITRNVLACKDLSDFNRLIQEHEAFISKELQMESVSQTLFNDLDGASKSLGAWGGDFVMLTYQGPKEKLSSYLDTKGINTVLSWNEMVYQHVAK